MVDPRIDTTFLKDGDKRNVADVYKMWKLEAIADDMASRAFDVHIAIENYQHDYNIGSIVRSANAFNVRGVHIIGKRHWNRRGAMATEKYLSLHHHAEVTDFIKWVRDQKLNVVGIDNIPGSVGLQKAELKSQSVLVFGQEGPGLSPEMQSHCMQIIAIEQFGSTRSVNVGVAAGIIMYEWVRRNGTLVGKE